MRIAYLVSGFPAFSETFVLRAAKQCYSRREATRLYQDYPNGWFVSSALGAKG